MGIPYYFNKFVPLEWWRAELKERPQDHKGPALVLVITTVVINALWGKGSALGFVCVTIATYPFAHYQIEYLLFLDAHETAYAVAVVGIQVFATQFPLFSAWALPLSVALASAMTVRGMRIRHLLQQQKRLLDELKVLNIKLTQQVGSLTQNSIALQSALAALKDKTHKKKESEQQHDRERKEHQAVILQVEADYTLINAMLAELTSLCQLATEESGITKQLLSVDENQQRLAQLTSDIELKNQRLTIITQQLEHANAQFEALIQRALKGEEQIQQGLEQFRTWALSLKMV